MESTKFINPAVGQLVSYKKEIAEIVRLSEEAIQQQEEQINTLRQELGTANHKIEQITSLAMTDFVATRIKLKRITYVACAALASTIGLILWTIIR